VLKLKRRFNLNLSFEFEFTKHRTIKRDVIDRSKLVTSALVERHYAVTGTFRTFVVQGG
jgi:hypothetical protein